MPIQNADAQPTAESTIKSQKKRKETNAIEIGLGFIGNPLKPTLRRSIHWNP